MYHRVTVRILAVAACGWLLALDASALSLGRARGAALIGRPLEVAIPVTLEDPQSQAPCADADVFYGDTRVEQAVVHWQATAPNQGVVRLSSPVPVDEPLVTLYVRVGCGQPTTRRYVLLSELPPEYEPPVRAPLVPPVVAAAPAARAPAAAPATPPRAPAAAPSTSPRRAAPAPVAKREPRATAAPAAAAQAPAPRARRPVPTSQARLRLEPLELGIERDPALRLTTHLGQPGATDPQRREALASLWQALQRNPEQSVQEALRLQGVERELQSVRDITRQNAATLQQLRGEVEDASSARTQATLLALGLLALLAVLVGWIAWRWYRERELDRVGQWFEDHGESVQTVVPPSLEGEAAAAPAPAQRARRAPAPAPVPSRTPATAGTGDPFQPSRGGSSLRTVGVEELIDVHDKADFFLSIGETEQAVALLEAHVQDQVETGALAWMDLLELYHSLGKRAEFDRLRTEFRQRFSAEVPDFEHFGQPTASLETYSRALSRIVALWPSRRVLDVIEESIFRQPGQPGSEPFGLEAYRELVLLYHVARDVAPEGQARAGAAGTFADTAMQPLNPPADRPLEPPLSERERLMIPPASARLGVDIDLDTAQPSDLATLDFDMSTFDPSAQDDETRPGQPGLDFDMSGFGPARQDDSGTGDSNLDFDISAFDPERPDRQGKA